MLRAFLRVLPLLAAFAFTAVLFTPFCGVLHRCGCTTIWSGGEERCNVHDASGPHCPWCEHSSLAAVVLVATVAGQAGAFYALRKRPALAAAAAFGAFPVACTIAGALAWLPTDYPHYLVLDARSRLHLPAGPIPCHGNGAKKDCCRVGGN